jgi:hypothetical protein
MQGNAPRSLEMLNEKFRNLSTDFNSENIKSLFEAAQFNEEELKTNYQLLLDDDNFQNYLLLSPKPLCKNLSKKGKLMYYLLFAHIEEAKTLQALHHRG